MYNYMVHIRVGIYIAAHLSHLLSEVILNPWLANYSHATAHGLLGFLQ